jgi:ribosomal protein S18 acetylase RimI-like enzyme
MSSPPDSPRFIYRVHRLPKESPSLLPFLAGKYASLRLNALIIAKTAFVATFDQESTFSASYWISRLSSPRVEYFIAVAYAPETPLEQQTIDRGDFVGTATLLGPFPKTEYELPESGGPVAGSDEEELKWQISSVYANPAHRGRGIGKMLVVGPFKYAVEQSKGKKTRLRAMVHPANATAKGLYLKLGFVDAGLATLEEAYLAAGDKEFIPENRDPGKWNLRHGLVTEKTSS